MDLEKQLQIFLEKVADLRGLAKQVDNPEARAYLLESFGEVESETNRVREMIPQVLPPTPTTAEMPVMSRAEIFAAAKAKRAEAEAAAKAALPPPPTPEQVEATRLAEMKQTVQALLGLARAGKPAATARNLRDFSVEYDSVELSSVAPPQSGPAPVAAAVEDSKRTPLPAGILSGMLLFAKATKQDLLYHPECGDGRLLISAAARFHCAGVGFESDRQLVQQAQENIRKARLKSLVSVEQTDFMAASYARASVVFLTMSAAQHEELLVTLLEQLQPGTRLVALAHPFEGWPPLARTTVRDEQGNPHQLFLWLVEDKQNASVTNITSWEWE